MPKKICTYLTSAEFDAACAACAAEGKGVEAARRVLVMREGQGDAARALNISEQAVSQARLRILRVASGFGKCPHCGGPLPKIKKLPARGRARSQVAE